MSERKSESSVGKTPLQRQAELERAAREYLRGGPVDKFKELSSQGTPDYDTIFDDLLPRPIKSEEKQSDS